MTILKGLLNTLEQLWRVVNANAGILQILLTILGFVAITRNQLLQEKFNERLNSMKKTIEAISTDRNLFMEAGLDFYKQQYKNDAACSEFVSEGHLIYRNGWVDCKTPEGGFYRLSDFTPAITSRYPSTQENIRINPLMPDPRESYADNCKFHLGKNLFNAPLYALDSVTVERGKQPLLTVTLGNYFDFYNTCEYLGFEMAYARRILGKKARTRRTMPRRFRQRELFDTHNRFPGIGINTITILQNMIDDTEQGERETYFLLHKRGNKVAEGMGNYHVVPAGSYQPLLDYTVREETPSDSVAETMKNTVLREFGEELLDYEEFLDLNTSELLQRLDQILDPVYLGVGFEPLNTKTEVLAALVIDLATPGGASLFGGRSKRSEFDKLFGANGSYEGDVMLRPLNTAMLKQYENDSRSTASMKEIMRILARPENQAIFGVAHSARMR